MTGQPTLLAALLEEKGPATVRGLPGGLREFRPGPGRGPGDSAPSRAQFHRWRPATYAASPTPTTAACLSTCWPVTRRGSSSSPARRPHVHPAGPGGPAGLARTVSTGMADVVAVFSSRSEFARQMEPQACSRRPARSGRPAVPQRHLPAGARPVAAPAARRGDRLSCLFLDPDGEAMRGRERRKTTCPATWPG